MCGDKLYSLLAILVVFSLHVHAQLSTNYYSTSCPNVFDIVNEEIAKALKQDARVGASLLRLHFHDCFVNGCDGSILLDDTPTFKGEKTAKPNNNSIRGFGVVDNIKAQLEKVCPEVVSCTDILAIVARDSVYYYGGPFWKVRLGRRDSLTANKSAANAFIPAPSFNLTNLISRFKNVGLSIKDLVVLSGAHTIGFARCTNFRSHIYNDTNIDPSFATFLQQKCPKIGNNNTLQPLDYRTRFQFDNKYYQNLILQRGLLHSDQQLYNGNSVDILVRKFATKQGTFFQEFAKSMVKMGNIKPLVGNNGEIRCNCRKINSKKVH